MSRWLRPTPADGESFCNISSTESGNKFASYPFCSVITALYLAIYQRKLPAGRQRVEFTPDFLKNATQIVPERSDVSVCVGSFSTRVPELARLWPTQRAW